jgi:hypothetical protein
VTLPEASPANAKPRVHDGRIRRRREIHPLQVCHDLLEWSSILCGCAIIMHPYRAEWRSRGGSSCVIISGALHKIGVVIGYGKIVYRNALRFSYARGADHRFRLTDGDILTCPLNALIDGIRQ